MLPDPINGLTGTCIKNVFDTSACETAIRYFLREPHAENSAGLNELLKKYGAIENHLKHKYHEIWKLKKEEDPSYVRPADKEFLEYCVLDVVGLPEIYKKMNLLMNPSLLKFISSEHSKVKG